MRIGVLTSGGDAPGMNAAVRAVVRRALARGHQVSAIHEGYAGLIAGGDQIVDAAWGDVSNILHLGGTILGTARSDEFRTVKGRLCAVENLVNAGLSRLVVVGGDGSLTGANLLRMEWSGHLETLCAAGRITDCQVAEHASLGLAGLVGSIDNDLWGTDRTIGCDTALHRIVDAVDTLTSTARSHQRSFVVEVMGRHCGFLALAAAVCTGADHVVIPERPADDWEGEVCAELRRGRDQGHRKSIVLLAEGASDRNGEPITAEAVRRVVEGELGIDTRTTVLGHVQRGGTPSAYDRIASTALGIAAADAVIDREREQEPVILVTRGPKVHALPMLSTVESTLSVGRCLGQGRYREATEARGAEFCELLAAFDTMRQPFQEASVPRRILFANVGAPAPGMNAALRTFVRLVSAAGHCPVLAHEGLAGLLERKVDPIEVRGISSLGATVLGTNRWLPETPVEHEQLSSTLSDLRIDGIVLVGGFEALLAGSRINLPVAVVPATISNNVPSTDSSIGCDTAVNVICEAVDRLKQSAIGSRNRVFFVEVMGRRCGYLARAAGVASGAELVYTDEDAIDLKRLQLDVQRLNAAMDAGRTVGIVLVADGVAKPYRAERLAALFHEESGGRFDTRVCVLGHLQQGGRPSPADRLLATRLVQAAVRGVLCGAGAQLVGVKDGQVCSVPIDVALEEADLEARRPKRRRQLLSELVGLPVLTS